jgi:hypothetical protein
MSMRGCQQELVSGIQAVAILLHGVHLPTQKGNTLGSKHSRHPCFTVSSE